VFEKFITTLEQGDINSPETAYEKYYANHVYKTELTIGSYYDLSMKKIGNLSKNPFILFYVMMVEYISFLNQL
jgi:hypothetical protein